MIFSSIQTLNGWDLFLVFCVLTLQNIIITKKTMCFVDIKHSYSFYWNIFNDFKITFIHIKFDHSNFMSNILGFWELLIPKVKINVKESWACFSHAFSFVWVKVQHLLTIALFQTYIWLSSLSIFWFAFNFPKIFPYHSWKLQAKLVTHTWQLIKWVNYALNEQLLVSWDNKQMFTFGHCHYLKKS